LRHKNDECFSAEAAAIWDMSALTSELGSVLEQTDVEPDATSDLAGKEERQMGSIATEGAEEPSEQMLRISNDEANEKEATRQFTEVFPVRNIRPVSPTARVWWTNGKLEGCLLNEEGSTKVDWSPMKFLYQMVNQVDSEHREGEARNESLQMVRERASRDITSRLNWVQYQLEKLSELMSTDAGRQSLVGNRSERMLTIRAISEYR